MEYNQQEVISIKEFAKRAGVSKQAIYSQLESRLQPYVVNLNNQKMIKIEALEKFYSSQVEQSSQSSFNQVEQPKPQEQEKDSIDKVLEVLARQLEEKDRQIEQLNKHLEGAYKVIEQQSILLDQQQKLNLIDKKEDIKEMAATANATPAAPMEEAEQEQPPKKKWFKFFSK